MRNPFTVRPGAHYNCREIARCCAKYQVPVVVSSDAHFCMDVGNVAASVAMLEEIGFPEELVLNADYDRFLEVVRKKTGALKYTDSTYWLLSIYHVSLIFTLSAFSSKP